jgi:hypothetical protein
LSSTRCHTDVALPPNFLTKAFRAQYQFGLRQTFAIVFGEADPPLC